MGPIDDDLFAADDDDATGALSIVSKKPNCVSNAKSANWTGRNAVDWRDRKKADKRKCALHLAFEPVQLALLLLLLLLLLRTGSYNTPSQVSHLNRFRYDQASI